VIVISHRGPYRFLARPDGTFEARRGAGGMVSALSPLLASASVDDTWIAAGIGSDDRAAMEAGEARAPGVTLRLLDLDSVQHHLHYDLVSNRVLWFLHHGLFDLTRQPRFDWRFREAWSAYMAVNAEFANAAAESAAEREIVLVQDYQLAAVPALLQALRPDLRIVHFTHTPFAGPQSIGVLPHDVARVICGAGRAGASGFHTPRWVRAYEASAREVLGPDAPVGPTFAASLGPDVDALREVAAGEEARAELARLDELVGDRQVIMRSDRIEPSKNIVRGFMAFDRLLEARPGLRERVVFVAMVYPSRQSLPEYCAYANEVEQIVDRVNDRWATGDWVPIVLDDRDDFARSIAAMQRYDVLLVNPLRDGLNLVAKEGPLLNRRDGTVCLSPEAGAYEELADAVLPVHPYDIDDQAGAMAEALALPVDERADRASRLRLQAAARTPADWLGDLVAAAGP
jgi:trehalose 6-phosphate synthase